VHHARLCRADGRLRRGELRLGRGERGGRPLAGGPVVVQHLQRDGVVRGQLLGARKGALRRVQLGLPLRHDSLGRGLFGLALRHQAAGRIHADARPLQLRLGLAALRLELRRIHAGQRIAGFDEIALVGEDFLQAAGRFRGDVDLDGLHAPVARGEALRQRAVVESLPDLIASHGKDQQGGQDEPVLAGLCHRHFLPCWRRTLRRAAARIAAGTLPESRAAALT